MGEEKGEEYTDCKNIFMILLLGDSKMDSVQKWDD